MPVLTKKEPLSVTVEVPVSIESDPLEPAAVAPEEMATEPVPAAPALSAELIAIAPLARESLPPDRSWIAPPGDNEPVPAANTTEPEPEA